ncbi:hypothetical protein SAMN04487818_11733 [Actinokineospora terrae]|uniref:Uncharacterized protein n=1 Tax=Actinokineospora terrae TaxID=155974 RepID=A0A1H9XN78_9PSEU|nr:hypothetical protein SAMN04487818_11733 [Actinokineospora terrae]
MGVRGLVGFRNSVWCRSTNVRTAGGSHCPVCPCPTSASKSAGVGRAEGREFKHRDTTGRNSPGTPSRSGPVCTARYSSDATSPFPNGPVPVAA